MHILTKKRQVLSMSKKAFFKGTFLLTCAGLLSRVIGFFYRIFLSHTIGAEGIGLFQLAIPLQTLLLAVTASGIQTALSRLIAAHLATGEDKKARDFFCLGIFFAFALSCMVSALLYLRADFFAVQILKEARTEELVQILSFSIPFATLHSCINSYYFARKKTEFPSGLQLIEQIVRVGSSYLLYLVCISEGTPVTAVIAAGGTLVSELVVAVLALLMVSLHFQKYTHKIFHIELPFACLKEICRTAFPVTLNRLLLSVLAGIEVVLIPQRLRMYGLSVSESLSIYGIFTGLALPCILFPATITNSASMMLMPSVAEMQALGYRKRIRYVTWQTIRASLYRSVYGDNIVSQSDCRGLHTDAFFRLPVSLSEHNAYEHPAWTWSDRTKSCTQCSGNPGPDPFCSIRDPPCRNPRLSVWNPFQRDSFQQPSYLCTHA